MDEETWTISPMGSRAQPSRIRHVESRRAAKESVPVVNQDDLQDTREAESVLAEIRHRRAQSAAGAAAPPHPATVSAVSRAQEAIQARELARIRERRAKEEAIARLAAGTLLRPAERAALVT